MAIMSSAVVSPDKKLGYSDYILSLGLYPSFKIYCTAHSNISYQRQCVGFLKKYGLFDYVRRLVKQGDELKFTLDEILHCNWLV